MYNIIIKDKVNIFFNAIEIKNIFNSIYYCGSENIAKGNMQCLVWLTNNRHSAYPDSNP